MTDRWKDARRGDGLVVRETLDQTWLILPADDRPAISICPCCDKPFASQRAAMLVADEVYPMQGGTA